MKMNMTTVLTGLDGKPLTLSDEVRQALIPIHAMIAQGKSSEAIAAPEQLIPEPDPLTLRSVLCNALMGQYEDEKALNGEEKVLRWKLAQKVHSEDEPDLTVEDVALVKKLVGKAYGPVVVGPALTLLDPVSVPEAK